MYTTYIIFSSQLEGYYIGYTSQPVEERVRKHYITHKGYSGKVNDWNLTFTREFETKKEARKLELKIKKRGAKRFLDDLTS